eukprot:6112969-Amphidinium_carterae.1
MHRRSNSFGETLSAWVPIGPNVEVLFFGRRLNTLVQIHIEADESPPKWSAVCQGVNNQKIDSTTHSTWWPLK